MATRFGRRAVSFWAFGLTAAGLSPAHAQGTIKHPGDHSDYVFEAEPHLSIGYKGGVGPGFRGTFVIVDRAFIPSINDSIGIGVGAEWLFYGSDCGGPPPVQVCHTVGDVMVPIVLQWNFFLHRKWSVFGEPGVALHFQHGGKDDFVFDPFTIYGGGRFHFSDAVTLTLRVGAPQIFHHDNVVSVGVSFLL
jgi:hypothetical protein